MNISICPTLEHSNIKIIILINNGNDIGSWYIDIYLHKWQWYYVEFVWIYRYYIPTVRKSVDNRCFIEISCPHHRHQRVDEYINSDEAAYGRPLRIRIYTFWYLWSYKYVIQYIRNTFLTKITCTEHRLHATYMNDQRDCRG